jgi:poly(A) polymerase
VPPGDELIHPSLPAHVKRVLDTLADAGHEVALVGGSVRDLVGGDADGTDNWDAATSARPEEVAALFADSTWQNRFGTVTIVAPQPVEVTSYRTEAAIGTGEGPTRCGSAPRSRRISLVGTSR